MRSMQSEARWVQELYPVDEMLAKELDLPLEKITLTQSNRPAMAPPIACTPRTPPAKKMLTREFTSPPSNSRTTA